MTLVLMAMIVVITMGMLTLGTVTIRTESREAPQRIADANARMALMLAVGRMQEELGDDRRATADASILGPGGQQHLVGVWESWSPKFSSNPFQAPPNYEEEKSTRFRSWLASGKNARDRDWALNEPEEPFVKLFHQGRDGFDLKANTVDLERGRYAWVVSQENTKAKLNVAGKESEEIDPAENTALHVQPRPSFGLSEALRQPESNHNTRADSLLTLRQVELDKDLYDDSKPFGSVGASYTVHSYGVLSNVVDGGLKRDLSLASDMTDEDFAKESWNGLQNPFRTSGKRSANNPASYKGERPLFSPIVDDPIISYPISYDPANLTNRLYAAGVPTLNHIRSFCRVPYYVYGSEPTVATRGDDHVAISLATVPPDKYYFAPAKPPQGIKSQFSINPVLNRAMFLLSASLGNDDQVRLIMTPVVALWNPYNVDIDFEGGVVYPWMDLPFRTEWKFNSPTAGTKTFQLFMANMMSQQWGRSIEPYFFCELTARGDGQTGAPIRIKAGEIRVFSPASETPIDFRRMANKQNRTIRMKPVTSIQELSTRGGLSMSMRGGINNEGFSYVMKPGETVTSRFLESGATGRFNYFVSLEDATRIKDKSNTASGQIISEIQTIKFASPVTSVASRSITYEELKTDRQPFGVLETFQHVANKGLATAKSVSDLLYTTNPRHSAVSHLLGPGTFTEPPHYQSSLRPVSSFDGAIQTSFDGQRAYWGAAQEPPLGRDKLPFFEVPREPILSLAALQHANLGSSAFSVPMAFANSLAPPYLSLAQVSKKDSSRLTTGIPVYDTSYLSNEAMWDEFFFSSMGPKMTPGSSPVAGTGWSQPNASITKSTRQVLEEFLEDPRQHALDNPRMALQRGNGGTEELVKSLLEPDGCLRAAAHLMVDGAFNVNSTDPEAWAAVLSGLRGQQFTTEQGSTSINNATPFPRFRHPMGVKDDNWNGFRALSDGEIRELAEFIVKEVKIRGPFLSLSEFINRRIENSTLGNSGAIQAGIDRLNFNAKTKQQPFPTINYPKEAQPHIITDSGVGIPGFLTQADILQSIAPVITCRSDSFIVRAYGDAKDKAGRVVARSCCEAVVQRTPGFVDGQDRPEMDLSEVSATNQKLGRRFQVVSFRWLNQSEWN